MTTEHPSIFLGPIECRFTPEASVSDTVGDILDIAITQIGARSDQETFNRIICDLIRFRDHVAAFKTTPPQTPATEPLGDPDE